MAVFTKKEDLELIRESGKKLSKILMEVKKKVKAGVSTLELDIFAQELIKKEGAVPAFLDYTPDGADYPYPSALCVSINEEIVHGIPSNKVLKEGDIVTIDLGLNYKGYFTDMAVTLGVGKIPKELSNLLSTTKKSLDDGIKAIVPGKRVGVIGQAVSRTAKKGGFSLVQDLSGHGVGRAVHEEPFVPNWGSENDGPKLVPGMVIAIEPMLTTGNGKISTLKDGYTIVSKDGELSAHFEHTVLITEKGFEVLTKY